MMSYLIFIFLLFVATGLVYVGVARVRNRRAVVHEKIDVRWWSIGLSVFAADVSLSYIINTSGIGFNKGLAVGSYGWTSVLVLIFFAVYILPKYMRLGIQTLPEYLEMRFSPQVRLLYAIVHIATLSFVALSFLYYSFGVLMIKSFNLNPSWQTPILCLVGLFSGLFLFSGGLKAAIKFDVFIAVALLVAGLAYLVFALHAVRGFSNLSLHAEGKLNALLPVTDDYLPWTQVFFGGVWLLHLNYWAFFQPMVQKVISAESLSQAQKGLLLTATLKLIVPFIFLIPGIVCFELYADQVIQANDVFPVLLKNTLPSFLAPIVILVFGVTVFSSSYAYLHAVGIMFTQDIYERFIKPSASTALKERVYFYTILAAIIVAVGFAPYINAAFNGNIFVLMLRYAFLPGIIVLFILGLFNARAYALHAWIAILLSLIFYFVTHLVYPEWIPIHVLAVNSVGVFLLVFLLVKVFPNEKPVTLFGKREIMFERNLIVVIWSIFIFTLVVSVYAIFS
jgi:solute:Na+ symporter, SSS family